MSQRGVRSPRGERNSGCSARSTRRVDGVSVRARAATSRRPRDAPPPGGPRGAGGPARRRAVGRRPAGDRAEHPAGIRLAAPQGARAGRRRDPRAGIRHPRRARRARPAPLRAPRDGRGPCARRGARRRLAAEQLREALALWSGDALADVAEGDVLRPAAARLDELRLVALERRIEAELACGREAELVGELESLTAEHALRERFQALRMLALYRCDRQAEALEVYRAARARLVEELGLEPGSALQELEQAILRHDASLDADGRDRQRPRPVAHTILVAVARARRRRVSRGAGRAARAGRGAGARHRLGGRGARPCWRARPSRLRAHRERLVLDGVAVRAAAFTSLTPGADLARLAREQDAELLLVDAPAGLLEDARLLGLLDEAACDVAVLVDGERAPGRRARAVRRRRPRLVRDRARRVARPVARARSSSWRDRPPRPTAVTRAGCWPARRSPSSAPSASTPSRCSSSPRRRRSSTPPGTRASSSSASPIAGDGTAWVRPARRSRRRPHHPTLLVRRGLRPGGLAPDSAATRFTWTVVG